MVICDCEAVFLRGEDEFKYIKIPKSSQSIGNVYRLGTCLFSNLDFKGIVWKKGKHRGSNLGDNAPGVTACRVRDCGLISYVRIHGHNDKLSMYSYVG